MNVHHRKPDVEPTKPGEAQGPSQTAGTPTWGWAYDAGNPPNDRNRTWSEQFNRRWYGGQAPAPAELQKFIDNGYVHAEDSFSEQSKNSSQSTAGS